MLKNIISIDFSEDEPESIQNEIPNQLFESFKKEQQEKLKVQKEAYDSLAKELKEFKEIKECSIEKKFVYQGTDLIKDVYGTPPHLLVANCCKILFTEDEMKSCVIVPSSSSKRPACCPEKVKLIRGALSNKYDLSADKIEKIWKASIKAFNSKGRGLSYALNKS